MLTYDMSQSGRLPLYEYLFRCIRDDIQNGILRADEKLPSKRTLAQHLAVSVGTVETAYGMLVSEGYLYTRKSAGFYVAPGHGTGRFEGEGMEEPEEELLIDFRANRCSLGLFPMNTWSHLMRQTLSNQDPILLRTVPFHGLYVLRRAIAAYLYECRGMQVSPGQIIIGAGTEYLYGRLLQLFGPQSVIAIEDPGYKKFADVSRSFGTMWDYIPMDENGMRSDYLTRSRANLVHVSPASHFPTGTVMSSERRAELLRWSARVPERYIIEDDYDSELRFSGKPFPTLFSMDRNQKVIYLNTFSKTLVPSLRISYMVLPRSLMEVYRKRLSFYSCSVSSFEQYVLARFISEGYFERHINRLKRHYRKQKELVLKTLAESPLAAVSQLQNSPVGTHLLLKMDTMLRDAQVHEAARARGMDLALLSDYCLNPSAVHMHQIVLNFASLDEGNVDLAVRLLTDIFREDITRRQGETEGEMT